MREATERAVVVVARGEAFALRPHTQAITLEVIMRAVFGVEDRAAMARLGVPLEALRRLGGNPAALRHGRAAWARAPDRAPDARRYLGPVDRELYALIAERRAAPDLAERDDVLSMLLLARDEQGEPMTRRRAARRADDAADGRPRDDRHLAGLGGRAPRAPTRRPGAPGRRPGATSTRSVKETLRLRPVIALVLRKLLEPLEVGGHELPAGTTVAPVILLVHRRADVYPEPEPSGPSASSASAPGTYSWIPFGGGVRRCLGAAFAQVEMQTVLQTLAESVALEAVGGAEAVRRRGITPRPGARRAGARARGSLACPPLVPDLFLQRDLPPGVPAARARRRAHAARHPRGELLVPPPPGRLRVDRAARSAA